MKRIVGFLKSFYLELLLVMVVGVIAFLMTKSITFSLSALMISAFSTFGVQSIEKAIKYLFIRLKTAQLEILLSIVVLVSLLVWHVRYEVVFVVTSILCTFIILVTDPNLRKQAIFEKSITFIRKNSLVWLLTIIGLTNAYLYGISLKWIIAYSIVWASIQHKLSSKIPAVIAILLLTLSFFFVQWKFFAFGESAAVYSYFALILAAMLELKDLYMSRYLSNVEINSHDMY